MIVSAIAAMSENRVIGKNNKLPWNIPEDLAHFKKTTLGKIVIMGRKTFESMGRPLPKRENLVVSRQKDFQAAGAQVFSSLEAALAYAEKKSAPTDEVFIIGGAEIYKLALEKTQRFYLTIIHQKFDGDAYFPEIDFKKFKIVDKRKSSQVEPNPSSYTFFTMEKSV
jgi:dihydrofolate reductase